MDNFDEKDRIDDFFKGSLRAAGQGEKPAPGEWDWLSKRLDETVKKPVTAHATWAAMALLLLFSLAANSWFFTKWRDTGNEVALLKTEFAAMKLRPDHENPGAKTHLQTTLFDTVYRTVVVRKTVYLTEKVENQDPIFSKTKTNGPLPENAEAAPATVFLDRTTGAAIAEKPPVAERTPAAEAARPNPLSESFLLENGLTGLLVDSLNQLLNENRMEDSLGRARADSIEMAVKTLSARFDSMMGLRTQPVRGCARPRFQITTGFSTVRPFSIDDLSSKSRGFFVAGEAQFGRHFTLGASVGYDQLAFTQSEKFDPRLLIAHPVSPGPEYSFYHIEGRQHIFSPEITAGYRFFSSKKWSPRLTAGWGWRVLKAGESEYEFKNTLTGEEIEVQPPGSGPQTRFQQLTLRAGIERQLMGHFSAFGDVGGLFDFGTGQRGATFGLARLGLGLQF